MVGLTLIFTIISHFFYNYLERKHKDNIERNIKEIKLLRDKETIFSSLILLKNQKEELARLKLLSKKKKINTDKKEIAKLQSIYDNGIRDYLVIFNRFEYNYGWNPVS